MRLLNVSVHLYFESFLSPIRLAFWSDISCKWSIQKINVVKNVPSVLRFYPVYELISLKWTRNLYRVHSGIPTSNNVLILCSRLFSLDGLKSWIQWRLCVYIVSYSKLCTRLWKIITVICVKISSSILFYRVFIILVWSMIPWYTWNQTASTKILFSY